MRKGHKILFQAIQVDGFEVGFTEAVDLPVPLPAVLGLPLEDIEPTKRSNKYHAASWVFTRKVKMQCRLAGVMWGCY
jgi:hypothetical protein